MVSNPVERVTESSGYVFSQIVCGPCCVFGYKVYAATVWQLFAVLVVFLATKFMLQRLGAEFQ